MNLKKFNKKRYAIFVAVFFTILLSCFLFVITNKVSKNKNIDTELARAMTYEQFKDGSDSVEGTDNVKFSAAFLRDINDDGYAEKIMGTCKEIGKTDTLYMELNVLKEGYLKNAKIEILGENFTLVTALPKDEQVKEDYYGVTRNIEFYDINSGTQKLISGTIKTTVNSKYHESIEDYSRNDNKVILTGIYVAEDGKEVQIRKEIDLSVDWYGKARANINSQNEIQENDIEKFKNSDNGNLEMRFQINTDEEERQLVLTEQTTKATIPQLGGYDPIEVKLRSSISEYNYNSETRVLEIIEKENPHESEKQEPVSYANTYNISVIYPNEAYATIGGDTVDLWIPVETYYKAHNNPNKEFQNPYVSDTAKSSIHVSYRQFPKDGEFAKIDVNFTKEVTKSKPLNIYNGITTEEQDDTYVVRWRILTGEDGASSGAVIKETANGKEKISDQFVRADSSYENIENLTTNVGIKFNWNKFIKSENGWIKVYDDDTNELIYNLELDGYKPYYNSNYYRFEKPVKHIRVETSENAGNSYLNIYCLKELDDEYITTNYSKEQFKDFKKIKTEACGYLGEQYVNKDTDISTYRTDNSSATLEISNSNISTQQTIKNERITINTSTYDKDNYSLGWIDGSFLIELPKEILSSQINNIEINNNNVSIVNYELIKKDGINLIKINTKNNDLIQQSYKITLDVNITPDPRIKSTNSEIILYASNEVDGEYSNEIKDKYDVNDNLNTIENVQYSTAAINLNAPSSLLTSQTISNYDEKGSSVVSPEIADISPLYANVDNTERTAKVGVQIKNNYSGTVSEVEILGKIPFKGNTYALSEGDMGSTYTSKMLNTGIEVPEELKQVVKVYYSENENPSKDLSNQVNGWKTANEITKWENIKTYLIDFGEYIITKDNEYNFYYTIQIPNGLDFNEISYSHHGVYFSLDTEEGKYKTQVESSKIGLRIAKKFNLELTKYQLNKDNVIPGATYSVREVVNGQIVEEAKTALTNEQGKLQVDGLYVEKEYEIQEIKSPNLYTLNSDKIRFIGKVDNNGNLTVQKTQGNTRKDLTVTKAELEEHKVCLEVEDEVKAVLKINKVEKNTDNPIVNVFYKITGGNLPVEGKTIRTDIYGNTYLEGLDINTEYTVQELKATGYYLTDKIKFKITNNEGEFEYKILDGNVKESGIKEENNIPTLSLKLENEKMPTYNLEITKIKKTAEIGSKTSEEIETLQGAKFQLYKENKVIGTYTTNEKGQFTINNLYQYIDGKEEGEYTLKETVAPNGYSVVKDIVFKVKEEDGKLKFESIDEINRNYTSDGNTLKLQIEDSPIFKIIKKDGETKEAIANTKFAIYNIDEEETFAKDSKGEYVGTKEIIDGKEYYTVTTNSIGEIEIDLPEGQYKVVELQAPEKYKVSKEAYYFSIGKTKSLVGLTVQWAKSVSGDYNSFIKTKDKCYLTIDNDKVVKYNDEGETEWEQTIEKDRTDSYSYTHEFIIELNDGSYICASQSGKKIIKISNNGEIKWTKEIKENNKINTLTETNDGGFFVGGYVEGNAITSSYANIIKYNSEGEEEYSKEIKSDNTSIYIDELKQTQDEGTLIVGRAQGDVVLDDKNVLECGNGDWDPFVIKYSKGQKIEWVNSFGGTSDDRIKTILETSDGSILVGGYFQSASIELGNNIILKRAEAGDQWGMLIKYDNNGNIQWAKNTQGRFDEINKIIETSDNKYMVSGYVAGEYELEGNLIGSHNDYFSGIIVKYDTKGNVEFTKTLKYEDDTKLYSILETDSGDYIVRGYMDKGTTLENGQTLSGTSDMIIKFKQTELPNSLIKDTEEIEGNARTLKLINLQNNEYLSAGEFSNNLTLSNGQILKNNGNTDVMVTKYNSNGNIKWAKAIGTNGNDILEAALGTNDGGVLIRIACDSTGEKFDLGNGEKFNLNDNDCQVLIKYDNEGNLQWKKSIGTNKSDSDDWSNSIKETQNGEILVTGVFYGLLDLEDGNTLNSNNSYDGMILKYSSDGKLIFAKSVGDTRDDCLYTVDNTSDQGFIVGGVLEKNINGTNAKGGVIIKYDSTGNMQWTSPSIDSWNLCSKIDQVLETKDGGYIARAYESTDSSKAKSIIKYDSKGTVQWKKQYQDFNNGSKNKISSIIETSDGDYVVGGYFVGVINLENGNILQSDSSKAEQGFLIKYDCNGKVKWANALKNDDNSDQVYVSQVLETENKNILVVGSFFADSAMRLGNGVTLDPNINNIKEGTYDGFIIKYNNDGIAEFAKSTEKTKHENVKAVIELGYGNYIIGGYTDSSYSGDLNKGYSNYGNDTFKNMVSQVKEQALSQQELEVLNNRKEFNITTKIEEFEGVKGGTISGEGEEPYEVVKYGDNSTKEIKITPNENYEILKITINGQEQDFQKLEDRSYTMPVLTNITNDQDIVVTFGLADNKIILNKVDKESKQPLQGAKFKIEQVDERTDPEGVIKDIVQNSTQITEPSVIGSGVMRANYHYFVEENGKYIATNTQKYQTENNLTDNISNTTANSIMVINLSNKTGIYEIAVNAQINSEQDKCIGYATISTTSSVPSYDKSDGRFMYISGNVPSSDYTYKLEGGKTYYLFLGYRKDDSENVENESMIINSIKLYKPNYGFKEQDGKYEIDTKNRDKESYIPIDLTNNTGKYNLTVNAESVLNSGNCGYAIITNSQAIPDYDTEEKVVNLIGQNNSKDYTIVLQGGQMYYLHLGYNQTNSSQTQENSFTINAVKISLNRSDFYNTEVTTNSQGKGITQLPFGKYKITETQAPEGYILSKDPIEIEFLSDGVKEFTIENEKQAEVLVHHYKKGTTEKVADDEKLEGKEGDSYVTEPQLFLDKYELDKDQNGKYILPANLKGIYTADNIEVNYEYVGKDVELNVHHYIEGTNIKVPLEDGNNAEDEVLKGKEGESYTTNPISNELLSSEYELSQMPENSTGVYEENENEVVYYYKKVKRQVVINKYKEDGTSPLEGAKFTIEKSTGEKDGTIYVTNQDGKITTKLGTGEYEITEVEAPEGYVLPENPTTRLTVNRSSNDENLNIINKTQKSNIIVHYYIEGTQNKVPLQDGTVAEDIVKTKTVGDIYATKELENVSQKYELIATPDNASGKITKEDTIVTYYYRLKDSQITNDRLEKTSTLEKIKTTSEKIPYTLTYSADLQKYKGNVIVTIVDQLQYEIDEAKSDIAGGIYNKDNKTITWTENINDVDTYKNGIKQVNISKKIELVYKNIDTSKNSVINSATAEINLEAAEVKESKSSTKEIPTDLYKDVEATLVWVDTAEQKDKRPESIILQLKNGENIVQSKTINVSKTEDQSKIKFEKVLKYNKDGSEIIYTADETVLEGDEHKEDLKFYSKTIQGTTVTNTFKVPEDKIAIKVTKEWEDQDNSYNLRPNSIILQIKNKTTQEIVAEGQIDVLQNQNSYTFNGLDKYDQNGNEIEYTADELEVNKGELEDYTKKIGEIIDKNDSQKEITITNIVNEITGKVIVKYIDKDTGEEISEAVEKTGVIGETFDVSEDKKDIEGYILAEEPDSKTGKYTKENQEKIYYYVEKSVVVEKHIDINTQEIIETKTYEGKEGEEYKTSSKTFEGYDLIEKDEDGKSMLPTNESGKMQKGTIEVIYYYSRKASVKVEYIYKQTGEKIAEDTKIIGHENDSYKTNAKEIKDYKLIEEPNNKTGKMKVVKNSDGTYNTETLVQYLYDKEKVYTGKQVDTTVANKIIPNAGFKVGIIVLLIMSTTIAIFFKIKLRKLDK